MYAAQKLLIALIPAGYLLGSIPFGLIVGKAHGVDPRKGGSGNIGATNVGRLLGRKFFWLVFVLDLLKGLSPTLAGALVLGRNPGTPLDWATYLLWLLVGFAAILGHMYSAFLRFKGGKGVATSAGVFLGLFPYYTVPGALAAGVFVLVFRTTRYVGLASIVGACVFPFAYVGVGLWRRWPITGQQLPLLVFSFLAAGMIVVKHRGNIARLLAGTEPKAAGHG